ncbi:hypothetical protein ACFFKU_17155 [Kineococcus gynurae]|uniref:YtxH domain-containing protein n=1 Tax=Kineococcus gynurae TaxID=452979 RepID=A0ABV5LP32_9ACTN
MRGKIIVLVAGATGYVLGARAGRERYEQIVDAAGRLWGNPSVQKRVDAAEDRAADLARQAGAKAKEQVGQAAGAVKETVGEKIAERRDGGAGGKSGDGTEVLGDQHSTRGPQD